MTRIERYQGNAADKTSTDDQAFNGSITVPTGKAFKSLLQTVDANHVVQIAKSGDTGFRFVVDADGTLRWSNGGALDTQLYRGGSNQLETGGNFVCRGALIVSAGATGARLNPQASGALSTVSPVSGTAFQCSSLRDVDLYVPVTFNPTAGAAATCKIELSPDNVTYSTLTTESIPAGVAMDGTVQTMPVHVPAGWRVRMTVANAALGTGTYY